MSGGGGGGEEEEEEKEEVRAMARENKNPIFRYGEKFGIWEMCVFFFWQHNKTIFVPLKNGPNIVSES